MKYLLLNLALALAWTFLTGTFSETNFFFGLGLGFFLLFLLRDAVGSGSYAKKMWQGVSFVAYFAWELLVANLHVAYEVITPKLYMRPAIVAVPLDLKRDLAITVLANLITLTPGTLSLEISEDKKTLYVHGMYVDDIEEFRRSIKQGFEKRVQELFE
ncbi:Na+/H+ antiporter subunit E [Aggregatilinea lenta]|uniref:Na+/H+ antiporter subunit E n=1 Tax=Aggregatilinea lenta TaxID=913108 RepID=UPI000E5A88F3|nr:Na+/H+ antiporter subunit E [Aggregatilinea lenta]